MNRPQLPRVPPGFFNQGMASVFIANMAALALNCYMAWTYRGGVDDVMLGVEVGCIALTIVCLYGFMRQCVRIWRDYQRARELAEVMFDFFDDNFDAFEQMSHGQEPPHLTNSKDKGADNEPQR